MLSDQRRLGDDWDYRTADTKEYTHGIHPYPAMMIPQVARRLIDTYGREGDVLLDPYCGTGTTLLEGMLANLKSTGTDLNPLAQLIAKAKTAPVELDQLDQEIENFIAFGLGVTNSAKSPSTYPDITNVDYWFEERVQQDLLSVRRFIDQIVSPVVADIFRVAFSLTVRKVSWTKNSEFKLVRMPPGRIANHNPDVFSTMVEILSDNRSRYASLNDAIGNDPIVPSVCGFNSVESIPPEIIAPETVDIVVTSPPYGDSKTTVAYGQFSRLSSQWLGFEHANRVDSFLMGGGRFPGRVSFGIEQLDRAIGAISNSDAKRAGEVTAFFMDYQKSIENISSVVKIDGYACYVVGNRTVKGIDVPTAEVTAAFFEMNGFEHVDTFERNIPNKRMPSMNSPTNIPGKLGKTIKSEIIVICRRIN